MVKSAFVRLSKTSGAISRELDEGTAGDRARPIELACGQVPKDFDVGSIALVWLGSDSDKGQPTTWVQGIRAIGRCARKEVDGKRYTIALDELYVLPRSIAKTELLMRAPDTYAAELTDAAIVGTNNYSSQVVQILENSELEVICAMIASMIPDVRQELEKRVPGLSRVELSDPAEHLRPAVHPNEPETIEVASILDSDPVYVQIKALIDKDRVGGVMLVGPPGTGKTWYARQVALKLTAGHQSRIREVQFHPSYQYEDFVEGFVPKSNGDGFRLVDKHLLHAIQAAQKSPEKFILIIDEFSRTDPARVLGETMTYMEGSMRDRDFYLPSGRVINIPGNLIFIATMNPEDRSVDEIDAAMERRWAKVKLAPDATKVKDFLSPHMNPDGYGAVIEFFNSMQTYIEVGHAFFRNVKDSASLQRLWDTQLKYVVEKRFRFDRQTVSEMDTLWNACLTKVVASETLPATPTA